MKILRFIRITLAHAFYSWAIKEIDVMHDDLPKLVLRRLELQDAHRAMFGRGA